MHVRPQVLAQLEKSAPEMKARFAELKDLILSQAEIINKVREVCGGDGKFLARLAEHGISEDEVRLTELEFREIHKPTPVQRVVTRRDDREWLMAVHQIYGIPPRIAHRLHQEYTSGVPDTRRERISMALQKIQLDLTNPREVSA